MACDAEQGKEEAVQGIEILLTEGVDWEKIWSGSPEGDGFPFGLRGPSYRRKDVCTIITLTDNAPQGLNKSLSCFPLTKSFLALPRPFVMGRPYTLIYNCSVNVSGAIRIALSAGPRPTADDISWATRHHKGRGSSRQ
ncbi:hypothetical protein BGW80DRAFT_1447056 [Lactifluus volemus]|nr:hypothetical protein BGW80DRAFT_1447056 [Lactifluus volemus]